MFKHRSSLAAAAILAMAAGGLAPVRVRRDLYEKTTRATAADLDRIRKAEEKRERKRLARLAKGTV